MARWRSHLADGTFALSVPFDSPIGIPPSSASEEAGGTELKNAAFWTMGNSYWSLPDDNNANLMEQLSQSGLVIFKGDLKYVDTFFLLARHSERIHIVPRMCSYRKYVSNFLESD